MTNREKIYSEALHAWFPAVPRHVRAVLALCGNSASGAGSIASAILKDFAMTTHVLRLVGTSYFASRKQTAITSVRHAVVCIGLDQLVALLRQIPLLSPLSSQRHDPPLLAILGHSQCCASICRELSHCAGIEGDHLVLCAMLHRLGEALISTVKPDAARILSRIPATRVRKRYRIARLLTGWKPFELGENVARMWNLPSPIQRCASLGPERLDDMPRQDRRTIGTAIAVNMAVGPPTRRLAARERERIAKFLEIDEKDVEKAFQRGLDDFERNNPLLFQAFERSGSVTQGTNPLPRRDGAWPSLR